MENEAAEYAAHVPPKGLRRMRNVTRFVALSLSVILVGGGLYKILNGQKIGAITDFCIASILSPATFYLLYRNKIQKLFRLSAVTLLGGFCFFLFTLIPALSNVNSNPIWITAVYILYGLLVMLTTVAYYYSVNRYKKAVMAEFQEQTAESDEVLALEVKEYQDKQLQKATDNA